MNILGDEAMYPVDGALLERTSRIIMNDGYGGVVVPVGIPSPRVIRPILEVYGGWAFQGSEQQPCVPNTTRFMAATRANNIPVKLVTEAKGDGTFYVPAEVYGECVLIDESHPAGVASEAAWLHDVGYDHFPALALCGVELFELLRPKKRLGRGHDLIRVAKSYDVGTQAIREELMVGIEAKFHGLDFASCLRHDFGIGGELSQILRLSDKEAKVRVAVINEMINRCVANLV